MTSWNRSTRLAFLVIGSLATSAIAQPASAPSKRPTQQELVSARAHFRAAEAAKARRDYKTAVTEYLAAHELFQDPEFFYDIGEVYRLAGDEPEALSYYQKYLDLDPGGRGAAAARTAVDELRRSIAARQGAAKRAADDAGKRDQPATSPEVPPGATVPATHPRYLDQTALTLLGAGIAAIGVGTGFLFSAQSADHDARTAISYQQVQHAGDRASQRGTIGSITVGAGVALVGGGLVWFVLHRDPGEPRTVTGWLAPGGGGLALIGPF